MGEKLVGKKSAVKEETGGKFASLVRKKLGERMRRKAIREPRMGEARSEDRWGIVLILSHRYQGFVTDDGMNEEFQGFLALVIEL